MKALAIGTSLAAAAALSSGSFDRVAIEPRRIEAGPRLSREERKKRRRRPMKGRPQKVQARNYVAHAAGIEGKGRPLCRAGWTLPSGPHRIAQHGEPVMCNECQRVANAIEHRMRRV